MQVTRIILAGTFLSAACGPVESTSLRWRLEQSIRQAERSGAQRLAPYELTAARRYHHKGKEEAGYSQYESAIDYFHKAHRFSKQAVERAEATAKMRTAPAEEPPASGTRAPPPQRRTKPAPSKGKPAAGSPSPGSS